MEPEISLGFHNSSPFNIKFKVFLYETFFIWSINLPVLVNIDKRSVKLFLSSPRKHIVRLEGTPEPIPNFSTRGIWVLGIMSLPF